MHRCSPSVRLRRWVVRVHDDRRPALDVIALRRSLQHPWRILDVVEETGSTNADLMARAAAGADIGGAVLIAENQTAGRGRHSRRWSAAPRAQIIMSVGVSVADIPTSRWGWLPLATGVAVVDTLKSSLGVRVGLKWPNDVVTGSGKVAGILVEVAPSSMAVVVGLGLNVTLESAELAGTAASLHQISDREPNRHELLDVLLANLGRRFTSWQAAGGADAGLMVDYRACSSTIGSPVRAVLPGAQEVVGLARSVDDQGCLCIETASGESVTVSAGDIVHLRDPSTRES